MNTYSQCEECEHPSICNTACLCVKSIPKTKCDCEEPKPNYPEMVWCDKCGKEIPSSETRPTNALKLSSELTHINDVLIAMEKDGWAVSHFTVQEKVFLRALINMSHKLIHYD